MPDPQGLMSSYVAPCRQNVDFFLLKPSVGGGCIDFYVKMSKFLRYSENKNRYNISIYILFIIFLFENLKKNLGNQKST